MGPSSEAPRANGLGLAAGLLLLSVLILPLLALRQPAAGTDVALVFAPGTTKEEALVAIASADGVSVRDGGWPNVVVARFSHDLGWTGLWSLGAWAALDPMAFGACFVSDGV